jgi:hypothetical protein
MAPLVDGRSKLMLPPQAAWTDPNLKDTQYSHADKNAIDLLNVDVIAELLVGILVLCGVNIGADAFDAHPECTAEGEVAIGSSIISK